MAWYGNAQFIHEITGFAMERECSDWLQMR